MNNRIEVIKPSISYIEYCNLYSRIKGSIKGAYKLSTFINRLNCGKTVLITDANKPVYRRTHKLTPIRIEFILK